MKKISLVELSQTEDKPEKVKYGGNIYTLEETGEYYSNKAGGKSLFLTDEIKFVYYNTPLIEIEEEPLLTDEEKEILKNVIKLMDIDCEFIMKTSEEFGSYEVYYLALGIEKDGFVKKYSRITDIKKNLFENLKFNEDYTLKELGL